MCTAPVAFFHARLLKDNHYFSCQYPASDPVITKRLPSRSGGERAHGDWGYIFLQFITNFRLL